MLRSALGASRIRSHTLENEEGNVKCPSFYRDDSISQAHNVSTMFRCVRRTFEHYSTNKVDFLTIKVVLWLVHTITVF